VKPLALTTLILLPALAWGQHGESSWKFENRETIHRSFDVSSASNPKKLLLDNMNGFIHINGYAGKEIQVTVEKHIRAESGAALADAQRDVTLDLSQQGNSVRLYEDGPFRNHSRGDRHYGYHVDFDFEIQVPSDTELTLKGFNQEIQVKQVAGDFDIHGFNGGIDLEDVSGAGTVETFNGKVKVAFSQEPRAPNPLQDLQRLGGRLFSSPPWTPTSTSRPFMAPSTRISRSTLSPVARARMGSLSTGQATA